MDAEALVRPVIEGEGLELVDVTFGREGGRRILRITVDRDGGVDLETISQLSGKVSRRLDLEGFEPGPYALEVTTPGIERPRRRGRRDPDRRPRGRASRGSRRGGCGEDGRGLGCGAEGT